MDKINEKFKGKIDVKNSMFKKVLSIAVCVVILLALSMCFSSSNESKSTSGKDLIVPEVLYFYHPDYLRLNLAIVKAGLLSQQSAFFAAAKASGNDKTFKDLLGLDVRDLFNRDYVKRTFGDKAAEKYDEVLKERITSNTDEVITEMTNRYTDWLRITQFILDNVVVEANKILARRGNPNTIKRVKKLDTHDSVTFHGDGENYQDNWCGEFIAEDDKGREFDQVYFACYVTWNMKKVDHTRKGGLCGDAPLNFMILSIGTNPNRDNWTIDF